MGRRYCTAEDVARLSGLPVDTLLKMNVDAMIERATAEIEKVTGYVFDTATASEDFWSPVQVNWLTQTYELQNWIEVSHAPIISVTRLTVDGQEIDPNTLKWRDNRIYLTPDSPISNFGIDKKIHVEYTYGITNEADRNIAKQLCIVLTLLELADTPQGRNELFKNSVYAQYSAGDVRPSNLPQEIINDLVKEARRLYTLIPKRGEVW